MSSSSGLQIGAQMVVADEQWPCQAAGSGKNARARSDTCIDDCVAQSLAQIARGDHTPEARIGLLAAGPRRPPSRNAGWFNSEFSRSLRELDAHGPDSEAQSQAFSDGSKGLHFRFSFVLGLPLTQSLS